MAKIQAYVEGWGAVAILNKLAMEGPTEKVTLEQNPAEGNLCAPAVSEADDPARVRGRQGSPEV